MGAFTYENVQGALSELVRRRIEVVEKRETGCYSSRRMTGGRLLLMGRGLPSLPTLIGLKVRLSQMSLGVVKRDGTL